MLCACCIQSKLSCSHLRALLSVCGRCSFFFFKGVVLVVCVSVPGVLFSVGVCVCVCDLFLFLHLQIFERPRPVELVRVGLTLTTWLDIARYSDTGGISQRYTPGGGHGAGAAESLHTYIQWAI